MRITFLHFTIYCAIFLMLSNCSVEKRLFSRGYHVEWAKRFAKKTPQKVVLSGERQEQYFPASETNSEPITASHTDTTRAEPEPVKNENSSGKFVFQQSMEEGITATRTTQLPAIEFQPINHRRVFIQKTPSAESNGRFLAVIIVIALFLVVMTLFLIFLNSISLLLLLFLLLIVFPIFILIFLSLFLGVGSASRQSGRSYRFSGGGTSEGRARVLLIFAGIVVVLFALHNLL